MIKYFKEKKIEKLVISKFNKKVLYWKKKKFEFFRLKKYSSIN